jgi:hypothetical protein
MVAFPCDHQLPGDASNFVGQRHGGQFGRLTLEKFDEPWRGFSVVPSPHVLNDSCSPTTKALHGALLLSAEGIVSSNN